MGISLPDDALHHDRAGRRQLRLELLQAVSEPARVLQPSDFARIKVNILRISIGYHGLPEPPASHPEPTRRPSFPHVRHDFLPFRTPAAPGRNFELWAERTQLVFS